MKERLASLFWFSLLLGCGSQVEHLPDSSDAGAAPDAAWFHQGPCTGYSPVVDAQVPFTLGEPLATQCADYLHALPATPIKAPLLQSGGKLDFAAAPDFIPVVGMTDSVQGYISKYELFCRCEEEQIVLDESLTRLIGHMLPGRGFVPL